MIRIHFPKPFEHAHPPIRNANEIVAETRTAGQHVADLVARVMGSWTFIIIQSVLLAGWVVLNITAYVRHWDPYPFILMNLVLSLQAAYTAPVIMMSQNRQAARDRVEAHNDYLVNLKAEEEIRAILEHLTAQNQALVHILQVLPGSAGTSAGGMPSGSQGPGAPNEPGLGGPRSPDAAGR